MKIYLPIVLLALVSIVACESVDKKPLRTEAKIAAIRMAPAPDMVPNSSDKTDDENMMSSSAAVENNTDTTRRFIRTADVRFRVKDVRKATNDIEDITRHFKGYVEYTKLESTVDNTITTPISADSSLETTYYNVHNNITVRVPNIKLDSTLRSLNYLVEFLDSRTVQARDVHIELLSNKLAIARLKQNQQRLETDVDEKGQKLHETTNAETLILNAQEQADMARLDNMKRNDSIKYSTIVLSIYQRPSIKRSLLPNEQDIRRYEPGFFTKLKEAFLTGWNALEGLAIVLVDIWWFLLLVAIGLFIYWRYKVYNKSQNAQKEK